MSEFRTMLGKIGDMGAKAEQFIFEHGTEYARRAEWCGKYWRGAKGNCFMNATHLAIGHYKLTYVEGFGSILGGIPILHAWCIDPRGLVVDPTWDDESDLYIGVPVAHELLMAEMERTKCYGVLFERGIKFNEKFAKKWKRKAVA